MKSKYVSPDLIAKHYSTRLFKAHIKFLERMIGKDRTVTIIECTGVPWQHLNADTNWVSEKFADCFYELLKKEQDLGQDYWYRVGCYAMSKEMYNPVIVMAMQLLGPIAVFKKIGSFSLEYNKIDSVNLIDSSSTSATLLFKSKRVSPHFSEICEEWRGICESIPCVFELPKGKCQINVLDEKTVKFFVTWENKENYRLGQKLYQLSVLALVGIYVYVAWMAFSGKSASFFNFLVLLSIGIVPLFVQYRLVNIRKGFIGSVFFFGRFAARTERSL